jgi:hypothetical protein
MAAQVQLAVLSRLQRHDRALITSDPATSITQFVREEGVFVPVITDIGITERPALVEVDPGRRRVRDSA